MVDKVLFSSRSDEWVTPQKLFDRLNKEFGIGLDVCATEENTKYKKYYTKNSDGLGQNWLQDLETPIGFVWGSIWCNPPYSQINKWVEKAYCEFKKFGGSFYKIILLLPARTDTKWFHKYIYKNPNCEIRFIKGRLKFSNSKNSAPFPSMIVIFRSK